MSKKWLYLLVVAVLVLPLILTACATEEPEPVEAPPVEEPTAAPEEPEPEEPTAAPEEPVGEGGYEDVDPTGATVLWWHNHTTIRDEALQEMVAEFNASNEWGIEVSAEFAGQYDEIYDKMLAAIAADDPTLMPQLTVGYANSFGKYMLADALVDMDEFVDSPKWGLTEEEQADFFPGIFESDVSPQFGDGHYRMGFPPNRSMEMVYYNQEWLAELGYDGPPTSWAEFKEMACAATDPDAGTVGLTVGEGASFMAGMIFSRHGNYVLEDGSAFEFTNEEVKASMQFIKDLYDEGCYIRPAERYGEQADFGNYKSLFTVGSSSGLPYYDQAVKSGEQGEFLWSVAPMPYMDGGDEPLQNIYGGSVAVPKTTPEQELAAWLFVKWLTSPEQLARWAKISGYFPVRQSVAEEMADYFEANPAYKTAFDLLPYGTFEAQWCPCYEEVRRSMADAFSAILDGADVDATLAQLEEDANVSLEENMPGVAVLETPEPTPEPTEEAEAPPPVAEEGVVVVGTTDKITTLDPADSYDFHTWEIHHNTMDTLLHYIPGTTELENGLATGYEVSDDGMEYTFTLVEGASFPDGTPFNAEAVKWSIDRVIRLEGDPNWLVSSFVESVEVVDEYTVKFMLVTPVSYFPLLVATQPYSPVSPNCYSEDQFDVDSLCSGVGPYTITSWERDVEMVLERYDGYPGTPPATPKVIIKYYADPTTMRLAVESGEIDVAWKTLNPTDYADLEAAGELQVIEGPGAQIRYICFNVTTPPFDQAEVRQAIAYAVDRDAVTSLAFLGTHVPLYSMVPIGMWSHMDAFPERDLAEAQALLEGAGYSEDNKLVMDLWWTPTHYGGTEADVATILKDNLEETGLIEVNLQNTEWATYKEYQNAGSMPVFLLGWYPDYLDPDNYTWSWGHSDASDDMGIFYSNPDMDALLEEAQVMVPVDSDERKAVYEEAQTLWVEDPPTIPLTQGSLLVVAQPGVEGVVLDPLMQMHFFLLSK